MTKDEHFYNELRNAYINCGEDEKMYAELFAGVSYEVDNLG